MVTAEIKLDGKPTIYIQCIENDIWTRRQNCKPGELVYECDYHNFNSNIVKKFHVKHKPNNGPALLVEHLLKLL